MTVEDWGVIAAIGVSLITLITQTITWLRNRRKEDIQEEVADTTASAEREGIFLKGAATANEVLQKTLQTAYADNERLRDRLASYEVQSQLKDTKIRELESRIAEKDAKIRELEARMAEVERKLQVYLGGS